MPAPDAAVNPAPPALRNQQFRLSAHIRDPRREAPPPAIEERRLAIYRELFQKNLESLLGGSFPVSRRMLGEPAWQTMVRGFMVEHRARTPLFTELGREWLRYLETRGDHGHVDPPWLQELAHYEWVELALDISDTRLADAPAHDADGDLLDGIPVMSPLAWPLAYRWPVHRLGPNFQPQAAPETLTFLLVLRDATHKVRFNELSALSFRLLQRLDEASGLSGRQQLLALAAEAHAEDEDFIAKGAEMLASFKAAGVVLGTRLGS